VARRTQRVLKHFAYGGLFHALVPEKQCIVPATAEGLVAYVVRFLVNEAEVENLEKVSAVAITDLAGTVTLTCSTADAEVWYTTDDNYPKPDNNVAALYGAPFVVVESCTVLACGYKSGSLASDVTRKAVTV